MGDAQREGQNWWVPSERGAERGGRGSQSRGALVTRGALVRVPVS